MELGSPALQVDYLPVEPPGKPRTSMDSRYSRVPSFNVLIIEERAGPKKEVRVVEGATKGRNVSEDFHDEPKGRLRSPGGSRVGLLYFRDRCLETPRLSGLGRCAAEKAGGGQAWFSRSVVSHSCSSMD